jgi:hypothetical protein
MNLELVPRDVLIDELAKRYPTMILGLHAQRGTDFANRLCWFTGDPMICLGLTAMLSHEIAARVREEEVVDPDQTEPNQ